MEHLDKTTHSDLGKRQTSIAHNIRFMLGHLLPDSDIAEDQHLKGTPDRFAKWILEFIPDPRPFNEVVKTVFKSEFDQMIAVSNIRFTALCAHHLLPFQGKASVGYVPGESGKVVGISKLARAVEYFAHRITIQEDITQQVGDALSAVLEPKGVIVVLEAEHECMTIRGVEQPGAITVTSYVQGCFLTNEKGSKDEFLTLVKRNGVHG